VSFDGITWEVTNDIGRVWTTAPTTHSKRFDVDFETSTGNAIVVYAVENTSTTCDLAYKVLPANESNFSGIAEQCIDDTTRSSDVQYTWIKAVRKPTAGSNEMIVIGFDGTDSIANAWVWNGTAWGNQRALLTAGSTGGYGAIGAAYAADGTKGMVASGSGNVGNVATFYWSGGAWTDSADFDINGSNNNDVRWLRLSADPATDDIQAVLVDSGSDLGTAYWNGSTWTVTAGIELTLDIATTRPADFAWDPSGSTGKLVWDRDTTGTTLSQRTCSPQCTGATSTVSTYAGTGRWITMYTDPTAADSINILSARMNSANALGSFSWSGGAFANYGDTALSSGTSANTYEGSSLDFQRAFDTTAPTYSNQAQSANSVPASGTVYLTANWADNVWLGTALLETNETGAFQNKSTYGSPVSIRGNFSSVNFTWSNASTPAGTNISWRVWANDTYGNLNVTPYMSFIIQLYNFTVSPAVDNFTLDNNIYIDRNFTLTNTGNQVLSITCSTNASWATNITACPSALSAGTSQNVTFRFNATGLPVGNPQVLLNFTDATAGSRTATANVTITLFPVYNFTASPAVDNFTLNNNSYVDRNFTLTNTGNQLLSISCSSNVSWATNTTACPVSLSAGSSTNVTFRFNATGQPVGNPQVLLTFTDATAGSRTATANVTITLFPVYNFTASPAVDNFTLDNNSYIDRNFTLTNTGNQLLNITCSSNESWATNITACPSALSAGSSQNVTFRFNAAGQPVGNPQVLLTFTDATAGNRTATANVTITLFPVYNFTASPTIDSFSVTNNTAIAYIDRNFTLTNTGNQVLSIDCSSNASWATNLTSCPVALGVEVSTNVTFRFNATGQPVGNPQVLLNFTDANAGSHAATANVTIETVFPTWSPLPSNQTVELGAAFSYAVSATDPQTVTYSINDTSNFKINSTSGLIQNNTRLSVGVYRLQVNATDASNNVNSTSINVSVVDTTIPTVIASSPSDNHIFNVSTVSFSFTDSDNALTNNCSLYIDGALKQSNETTNASGVTTTITQSSIANGAHTWNITCSDGFNTGASATMHFTVDTVAPSVSIQSPSGTYNSSSVALDYTAIDSGTGVANCSYKLDNGSVIPEPTCQNVTLSGVSEGAHAVTVYATDNAGNTNSTSSLFFIDSLPPSISIDSPTEGAYYNSSSVDLNYTAVDSGSGVENCSYKLDGGAVVPEPYCDNVTLSSVSQGTHTVTVYSTDYAGNTNGSSVSFKVDTTPPSVTLSSPAPDLYTNSTSLTFSFTETDNMAPTANCTLRIDNAANQTNATVANNTLTSFSVSSLSQGTHNWTVSCLDLASNNGTAAARNFTVDTTQPTVSITSPAGDSFTNSRTIAITGTSTDTNLNYTNISIYQGTTLISSTTNSSAAWSTSLSVGADGTYNITATAYDKAGNSNSTTVQNITVDTANPSISINSPASSSFLKSRTISINLTASDTNLDYTNISAVNSTGAVVNSTTNSSSGTYTVQLTVPVDGTYNITATAHDKAGNYNSSTTSNVVVDTVVPSVSIQSPTSGAYNSTSVDLNYTATDSRSGVANCSYKVDSGSVVPEPTCQNVTLSGLSQGNHAVTVYSTDNAGNTNSTSVLFSVDSLPPSVSIQSPTSGYHNTSSIDLNYTATDSGTGVENCSYRLDGDPIVPEPSCDNAVLTDLSEGAHTVTVYSTDYAGNTNSSSVSFTVDTIQPSVSIQSPSGTYNSTSVDLNYTATDSGTGVANCSYRLDSGSVVPEPTCQNVTLSGLSQGNHAVTVYATDRAGNTKSSSGLFSIDSVPPSISIDSPTNGTYYSSSSVGLNYSVADSGSGVENCSYRLDSDPEVPEPYCDNVTLSNLSEGAHAVTVYSTDWAGNANSSNVSFAVSTVPPSVNISSPLNDSFLDNRTITVDLTISSPSLNHTDISIRNSTGDIVDSTTNSSNGSVSVQLSVPADGVYGINATAYDKAGNSNSSAVENITVDTMNPSLAINSPAGGSILYSRTIPISLTVSDTNLNRTIITTTNSTGSVVNSATSASSGTFTIYLSVPVDGVYNITATAHDKAGNINSSTVENITVAMTSNMTVTLVSPPDGNLTNGSSNTVDFVFNVAGTYGNSSCRLYLNGVSAAVNSSVIPDTDTVLHSGAAFREGANTWRVGCTFASWSESSSTYTLNVDTRPPVWIIPRSYSVVHWQLTMNCYNASFSLLNSTMLGDNSTAPSGVSVYRQFFFNPGSQCFAGEVRLVLWNG